jgi:chorismate mutase/prephenate dehydratase
MTVVYLGPQKTFTEKVAGNLFPFSDVELIPLQPIRNVVMAVENDKAEYGVVPLENIYNGHVIHTLDSLTKCRKAKIIQETSLKVVHCLGAFPCHGVIERIYSKDQALEQCDDFIYSKFPDAETVATGSTAEAAEIIAREKVLNAAAIASEEALKKSGLEIIASDLCPNNSTRFVVLGQNRTYQTGDDKTLIAIHPHGRDHPGVLADCLEIIRSQHINLECIYSRPDRKKGYYFYLELDGHENDPGVKNSLQAVRYSLDPHSKHPDTVKVLGSFSNSHWKET